MPIAEIGQALETKVIANLMLRNIAIFVEEKIPHNGIRCRMRRGLNQIAVVVIVKYLNSIL